MNWQYAATIPKTVDTLVGLDPEKRIMIVWDEAPWHKNKLIRAELNTVQTLQDVHSFNFPPYAPDHTPIEHVWNDTKNAIKNVQHDDFESTVAAIEVHNRPWIFTYKI